MPDSRPLYQPRPGLATQVRDFLLLATTDAEQEEMGDLLDAIEDLAVDDEEPDPDSPAPPLTWEEVEEFIQRLEWAEMRRCGQATPQMKRWYYHAQRCAFPAAAHRDHYGLRYRGGYRPYPGSYRVGRARTPD